MRGLSFDDLVAVAALGVSRKGFAAPELDGPAAEYAGVIDAGDPAAALLDAAALLTVAGRAGVLPPRVSRDDGHDGPPRGPSEEAAGDAGRERELSARGARLLARLGGLNRPRGGAGKGQALLGDLLIAMRQAGYVLPAPLLPDLLDTSSRTAALRPLVAAVLGPRGVWLAGHRADWREVAGPGPAVAPAVAPTLAPTVARAQDASAGSRGVAGADGEETGGGSDGDGGPEAWRVGRPAERLAYLSGLRELDAGAARELLAAGWSRESKSERASLIGALAHGLTAEDEEFLEHALDDRAAEVRRAAGQLLARLPGSAFSRRAADRATAVLRLEGRGPDARLVARLPDDADQRAVRDGLEPKSPTYWVDDRAWRLSQLIAGVPLPYWTARFGLTPAQIVALPVKDAAAVAVRAGWRLAAARDAALRQATVPQATARPATAGKDVSCAGGRAGAAAPPAGGDVAEPGLADWAIALLEADFGVVDWPPSAWVPDADLAGLLSADLRAARAAALLTEASSDASHPRAQAARLELASHPVPWSAVLADAVLHVLAREMLRPKPTVLSQAVIETAGRGMPATGEKDYAAALTRLADSMPQSWVAEVIAAAETIALRRAFLAELR